jgi:hypothetical protein
MENFDIPVGLVAAILALGCVPSEPMAETDGDTGDTETGDGDGDPSELPPELPPVSCWDDPVIQLAEFDGYVVSQLNPCGYFVVVDEDLQNNSIVGPTGMASLLDPQTNPGNFLWDRSGRFYGGPVELGAVLGDLQEGELLVIASSDPKYGFVPSLEPQVGSWFWTCTNDALSVHWTDQSVQIADMVDCESVVGSDGGPWLAYASHDGSIHAFDCDESDMPTVVGEGFINELDSGQDPARADQLTIDYDGRRIIHTRNDSYIEQGLLEHLGHDVISVAEATTMRTFGPEVLGFVLGYARGAPMLTDGPQRLILGEGEPIDIAYTAIGAAVHDDQGEIWVLREGELSRTVDHGAALLPIVELPGVSYRISAVGGDHAAVLTNGEQDLWVVGKDGPPPSEPTARSLVPWEVRHVFSDGTTVAIGALQANGGMTETLMIRPDGSILAARPYADEPIYSNQIRWGFELADGRFMVGADSVEPQMWIVDPNDGSELIFGPPGATEQWASADGRVILFDQTFHANTPALYWYGAPPQN